MCGPFQYIVSVLLFRFRVHTVAMTINKCAMSATRCIKSGAMRFRFSFAKSHEGNMWTVNIACKRDNCHFIQLTKHENLIQTSDLQDFYIVKFVHIRVFITWWWPGGAILTIPAACLRCKYVIKPAVRLLDCCKTSIWSRPHGNASNIQCSFSIWKRNEMHYSNLQTCIIYTYK